MIDLLTEKVNLLEPQDLSQQEMADIIFLVSQPQWQAFRNYVLRNAVISYKEAGMRDEKESYLLCRLSNYIIAMIESVEKMAPVTEEKQKNPDHFDDQDIAGSVVPGSPLDGLPLAPAED